MVMLSTSVIPPSNVPKIFLHFETSDGSHFTLQVNPNATVAQLKREVAFEEKIDVHNLKIVLPVQDTDDPETLLVSEPHHLPEDAVISQYPVADATIFIFGLPPPVTPPPSFNVCVVLDDGRKLEVKVGLQQTLNEFREAVRLQRDVPITDDVLILVGKEVIGHDIPIWDLGFTPDCVIHAVPFVSVTVEIDHVKPEVFDTLLLHPLTRLSAIRKRLEQDMPSIYLEKYWFTLDGMEHLSESRRLWDLDFISGSVLYMRTCILSFNIRTASGIHKVDAEETETIWGLKERLCLITGINLSHELNIIYRGKWLQDDKTVKEEGLVGGETLFACHPSSRNMMEASL